MRLPSIKNLIKNHLVDTLEDAKEIRNCLEEHQYPRANKLMDTCGLESICIPDDAWNNCQTPRHVIDYFNPGDPYVATVMRIDGGSWFIGCWGDTLARLDRSKHE